MPPTCPSLTQRTTTLRKRVTSAAAAIVIVLAIVAVYEYYPRSQKVVEINLTARQWYYDAVLVKSTDPAARATTAKTSDTFANTTIVVTKGDLVLINLTTADVEHGFAISGYLEQVGLHTVRPGQSVTITFAANTRGSFIFYCTHYCGHGHSVMFGTLIVL